MNILTEHREHWLDVAANRLGRNSFVTLLRLLLWLLTSRELT